MKYINEEKLMNSEPGTILATGSFVDGGDTDICSTGKTLRWVAVRGDIHDWAIYFQPCYYDEYAPDSVRSESMIRTMGDKFPKSMTHDLKDVKLDKFAYYWYRG